MRAKTKKKKLKTKNKISRKNPDPKKKLKVTNNFLGGGRRTHEKRNKIKIRVGGQKSGRDCLAEQLRHIMSASRRVVQQRLESYCGVSAVIAKSALITYRKEEQGANNRLCKS